MVASQYVYPNHGPSKPRSKVPLLAILIGLSFALGIPLREMTAGDVTAERLDHSARLAVQELRAAVHEYRQEHGAWPGRVPGIGTPDGRWLNRQLTRASNREGATERETQSDFPFGPYLPGGLPRNPVNGRNDVTAVDPTGAQPAADGTSGWLYDARTGEVWINSPGAASDDSSAYIDL
jgi:hypothetical protein